MGNITLFTRKPNLYFKFPFFYKFCYELEQFLEDHEESFQNAFKEKKEQRKTHLINLVEELLPQFEDLDLVKTLRNNQIDQDPHVLQIIFEDLIAKFFPEIELIRDKLVIGVKTEGEINKEIKYSVHLSTMEMKHSSKQPGKQQLATISEGIQQEFSNIGGEKFFLELLSKIPLFKYRSIEFSGSSRENAKILMLFGVMLRTCKSDLKRVKTLLQLISTYPGILRQLSNSMTKKIIDEEFFLLGGWVNTIFVEVYSQLENLKNNLSLKAYFEVIELLYETFEEANEGQLQNIFQEKFNMKLSDVKKELSSLVKLQNFFHQLKERVSQQEFLRIGDICMNSHFTLRGLILPFKTMFPESNNKVNLKDLKKINNVDDMNWMKWDSINCVKMMVFASNVQRLSGSYFQEPSSGDWKLKEIIQQLKAALDTNAKVLKEKTLFGRLRLIMTLPTFKGKDLVAQEAFKEFTLFVIKSILKIIQLSDENPNINISNEESSAIQEIFCDLVKISDRSLEVINLVAEFTQGNLSGNINLILNCLSTFQDSNFLVAFLDKMSLIMKEKLYSDKNIYSEAVTKLENQLNIRANDTKSLILCLLKEYSDYVARKNPRINLLKILFFLRTQLSVVCSRGITKKNNLLKSLLNGLKKKKNDSVYNTCRFFLLAEAEILHRFLNDPSNDFNQYLPECKNSDVPPPRLLIYAKTPRESSYNAISTYINNLWKNLYLDKPVDLLEILTPIDFLNLCTIMVNFRFKIFSISSDQKLYTDFTTKLIKNLDPAYKTSFSTQQKEYLILLIKGFQNSKILCFPTNPIPEIKIELVFLIINITSLCVAFLKFPWIFSNIIKSFGQHKSPTILFNRKDILIMNDQLNVNMKGRKFYECINCKTPFSIGNCGLADSLGKCIKCKRPIGGEKHTNNPNTREIDIVQFENQILNDPNYYPNFYNPDKNTTFKDFHKLTFRLGHTFLHSLYIGCAEALFGPHIYTLLIPNFQMNFAELKIPNNNLGLFFYRHIDRNLEAVRKLSGIRNNIVAVVASIFQSLIDVKDNFKSTNILTNEQAFESLLESFNQDSKPQKKLVEKIDSSDKGFSAVENLVKKIIRREDVSTKMTSINYFLYINLRNTKNININNFELELEAYKKENLDIDFKFLNFYLHYKVYSHFNVLTQKDFFLTNFSKITLGLYQMGTFMNNYFSLNLTFERMANTQVIYFMDELRQQAIGNSHFPINPRQPTERRDLQRVLGTLYSL